MKMVMSKPSSLTRLDCQGQMEKMDWLRLSSPLPKRRGSAGRADWVPVGVTGNKSARKETANGKTTHRSSRVWG